MSQHSLVQIKGTGCTVQSLSQRDTSKKREVTCAFVHVISPRFSYCRVMMSNPILRSETASTGGCLARGSSSTNGRIHYDKIRDKVRDSQGQAQARGA